MERGDHNDGPTARKSEQCFSALVENKKYHPLVDKLVRAGHRRGEGGLIGARGLIETVAGRAGLTGLAVVANDAPSRSVCGSVAVVSIAGCVTSRCSGGVHEHSNRCIPAGRRHRSMRPVSTTHRQQEK